LTARKEWAIITTTKKENYSMDKNALKVQALLERVSSLTTEYENRVADLRVDLTLGAQEKEAVQQELEVVKNELDELRKSLEVTEAAVSEADEELRVERAETQSAVRASDEVPD
jgi:chromosome segregation ATPase